MPVIKSCASPNHVQYKDTLVSEKLKKIKQDHHGYVPRMMAGLKALGHNTDKLNIHLIQFANLFRGKEK